ncbi:hypothetical protein ACS0PU_004767 [Formica fusca]
MPRWCAVPYCRTDSRTEQIKRSLFGVPKDPVIWKKWEEAIPGIVKLRQTDVICDKHFEEKDISREWIKFDANDQVIARVTYKRPQLKKQAVPTKFGDVPTGNCEPLHEYAKRICNVSVESSNMMKPSIQIISTLVDTVHVPLPVPDIGTDISMSFSPMEISSCEPPVADLLVPQKPFKMPSSIEISERE